MNKMNIGSLISRFKGNYEKFPVYEFKLISPHEKRSWLRYDYDTGDFVPYDDEHSILFVEDSYCPIFLWFEPPYQKNIIWSWAKHGNWGANVEHHPNGNAWHYMLREGETEWGGSWGRDNHPNDYVTDYARATHMRGGSSGGAVDKHICDPHILRGLVRNYFTKEVLTFPDKFDCFYCGEHEWKTQDKRWADYQSSAPSARNDK